MAIIYIVLAVYPLHQSMWLEPISPILIPDAGFSSSEQPKGGNGVLRAFANARAFGYYLDSGYVTFMSAMRPALAIDENHIMEMDEQSDTMFLRDAVGLSRMKIPITGYPYIAEKRLFILRQDQQASTEIDREGRLLWSREFGTPITSSSISGNISAWGLLDGSIKIIGNKGSSVGELRPADYTIDSKYPCIYSVATSPNGECIATLYGLEDQYFLVFTKKSGTYELVYKKKLAESVITSETAAFSGDGSCAIARTADGLVYYDVQKKAGKIIQNRYFGGDTVALKILPLGTDAFVFLLANRQERFAGILKRGAIEALFPVGQDAAGIATYADILAISNSSSISRYRIKGK